MKVTLQLAFLALLSNLLLFSCGGKQKMPNTVDEIIKTVKEHTTVVILGDEKGPMMAVTPEYGAKVIAISLNGLNGKNLIWLNPEIVTAEFWAGEVRNWNIGGARTWLSPEADFYLDKEKKWFVPQTMDPGNYKLIEKTTDRIICQNEFHIKNVLDQEYHLKIVRDLKLLSHSPISIPDGVQFVGLKFTHRLVNLSNKTIGKDVAYASLWSLIQLDAGGTMIFPIKKDPTHDNITVRDYGPVNFNTVPPERIAQGDDWVSVKIDGKFRCKLGLAPWAARNGIAYLHYQPNSENGVLYLKLFPVDPDAVYLDHPWEKPYDYGDAIQLYNDDGTFGGFCEIECQGPARELLPGEFLEHTITFSIFVGKLDDLKNIAAQQLQVNMKQVKLF